MAHLTATTAWGSPPAGLPDLRWKGVGRSPVSEF